MDLWYCASTNYLKSIFKFVNNESLVWMLWCDQFYQKCTTGKRAKNSTAALTLSPTLSAISEENWQNKIKLWIKLFCEWNCRSRECLSPTPLSKCFPWNWNYQEKNKKKALFSFFYFLIFVLFCAVKDWSCITPCQLNTCRMSPLSYLLVLNFVCLLTQHFLSNAPVITLR